MFSTLKKIEKMELQILNFKREDYGTQDFGKLQYEALFGPPKRLTNWYSLWTKALYNDIKGHLQGLYLFKAIDLGKVA